MYNTLDASMLRLPGSIPELAPIVKKYGLEGINCPGAILDDAKLADEALAAVKEHGLKWGLLPIPIDTFTETIEGKAFEDGIEKLKKWAEAGEKLGVRYSYNHIWPSSDLRPFDENFEWHVKRLEKIQTVLKPHGIKYGFEFLGPYELRAKKYPFVHTIAGVLSIADAAGGYAGFLFDTYHWYCGSNRLDDLYFAALNCHRMVSMHLNDGTAGLSREEQKDMIRQMPMTTGIIDTAFIYKLFDKSGYEGPAMLEPMNPTWTRFASMPVEDCIQECKEAFNRVQGD